MRAINEFELIDELYGLFECTALPDDEYTMGRNGIINTIIDYIDNADKIEVQPVVHAKWVTHNPKNPSKTFHCSNCLGVVEIPHYAYDCYYKYCPNCGARMGG